MHSTIKQLHQELRGNYSAGWNADKDVLLKRILPEMETELGEDRLARTVRQCMRTETFLSEEALRRCIPSRESTETRCAICQDTGGYRYVVADYALTNNGNSSAPSDPHARATRCRHDGTSHECAPSFGMKRAPKPSGKPEKNCPECKGNGYLPDGSRCTCWVKKETA